MKHLEVTFNGTNKNQNSVHVALEGSLNNMNAINFKKDLLRIIETEKTDCEVNIEKLETIDITGLNALAMAHRNLEKQGRTLTVVSSAFDQIDEFLHVTKFNRFLNIQRA